MTKFDDDLSRTVSLALRHDPARYELCLDRDGWVRLSDLIAALRISDSGWSALTLADLERMIEASSKRRHEISGNRIRALYGHSTTNLVRHVSSMPPVLLFHGTSPEAWSLIQNEGLLPMRRQYVHLASDRETAESLGRKKAEDPVVIAVRAQDAHEAGIRFDIGNDLVWLVGHVPAQYLAADRDQRTK